MQRQGINQQQNKSQSNIHSSSGWLQRAAVRAENELQSPVEGNSGLNRSFVNVPVRGDRLPVVQPKLTIGKVGDRYEQEADRVASQVVQQGGVEVRRLPFSSHKSIQNLLIQRKIWNEDYKAPDYAQVDLQAPLIDGENAYPNVYPPGWCQDHNFSYNSNNHGSTKPQHHQRGHLIGKQFGAKGFANNLVTLTAATNGADMQYEEDGLKQYINKNPKHQFRYRVTANYGSKNYFHTGKKDPTLKKSIYLKCGKGKAPDKITMTTEDLTTKKQVQNATVENGLMYLQHLY
ncbi:MAG: DNA/RNA non-specific endonuclease [Rivularia sp. (in: Bacteria)]|nr:DNA/RNA non-specific endonuclease [Rivularia sp. MS3]